MKNIRSVLIRKTSRRLVWEKRVWANLGRKGKSIQMERRGVKHIARLLGSHVGNVSFAFTYKKEERGSKGTNPFVREKGEKKGEGGRGSSLSELKVGYPPYL